MVEENELHQWTLTELADTLKGIEGCHVSSFNKVELRKTKSTVERFVIIDPVALSRPMVWRWHRVNGHVADSFVGNQILMVVANNEESPTRQIKKILHTHDTPTRTEHRRYGYTSSRIDSAGYYIHALAGHDDATGTLISAKFRKRCMKHDDSLGRRREEGMAGRVGSSLLRYLRNNLPTATDRRMVEKQHKLMLEWNKAETLLIRGDLEDTYNINLPSIDEDMLNCGHSSAVASSGTQLSKLHQDLRNAGQSSGGLMDMHINLTENMNVVLVVYLPMPNGNVQAVAVIQRERASTYFHSRNYYHHSLHLGTLIEYLKQFRECPVVWYTGKPKEEILERHRDNVVSKRCWMSFFSASDPPLMLQLQRQYRFLDIPPVFFQVQKRQKTGLSVHRSECSCRIQKIDEKPTKVCDGPSKGRIYIITYGQNKDKTVYDDENQLSSGSDFRRLQNVSGCIIAP